MRTGKMSETTIGVDVSKEHLDAHGWPGGDISGLPTTPVATPG